MERRYGGQREGKCKMVRRDNVQREGGESTRCRTGGRGHRRVRRGRV
jgi:hypothetical protein